MIQLTSQILPQNQFFQKNILRLPLHQLSKYLAETVIEIEMQIFQTFFIRKTLKNQKNRAQKPSDTEYYVVT